MGRASLEGKFDLEKRTTQFGKDVLSFVRDVGETAKNRVVIDQLIRAGTSIGANYMEATGAESKKDFRHKISICKKESRETQYWLRLFSTLDPANAQIPSLLQEAHELTLIFSKIVRSCDSD
jgi:four helix bundle protein